MSTITNDATALLQETGKLLTTFEMDRQKRNEVYAEMQQKEKDKETKNAAGPGQSAQAASSLLGAALGGEDVPMQD